MHRNKSFVQLGPKSEKINLLQKCLFCPFSPLFRLVDQKINRFVLFITNIVWKFGKNLILCSNFDPVLPLLTTWGTTEKAVDQKINRVHPSHRELTTKIFSKKGKSLNSFCANGYTYRWRT